LGQLKPRHVDEWLKVAARSGLGNQPLNTLKPFYRGRSSLSRREILDRNPAAARFSGGQGAIGTVQPAGSPRDCVPRNCYGGKISIWKSGD